jgi:hypothetical protein
MPEREWALEGYVCDGPHEILRWCSDGPSIVVARHVGRGRRWLRATRKIGAPGWWITAYKLKRGAIQGLAR